jgi:hypothetical protein
MKKITYTLLCGTIALAAAHAQAHDYNKGTRHSGMQGGVQSIEPSAGNYQQRIYLDESDVQMIQRSLQNRGYNPGPLDGIMGPRTEDALRRFQTDNGINANGRITAGTLDQLDLRMGQ